MSQLTDDFLKYLIVVRCFGVKTYLAYDDDLVQFCSFLDSKKDQNVDALLLTVHESDVLAYIQNLKDIGFNSATINRKTAAVRSFYKWLLQTKKIQTDPTIKVRGIRISPKMNKEVTPEQISALLSVPQRDTVSGLRNLSVFEIMLSTGARLSELVDLNMDCVKLGQNGEMTTLQIGLKRQRIVTLGASAQATFSKYILLRGHVCASDPVFVNKCGQRISARSLRRFFHACLAMAGIPSNVNTYGLRHAYKAYLVSSGLDKKDVKDVLGMA